MRRGRAPPCAPPLIFAETGAHPLFLQRHGLVDIDSLLNSWVRIHSQNCHFLFAWFHIVIYYDLLCWKSLLCSCVCVWFTIFTCDPVLPMLHMTLPISHSRESHGFINLLVLICILQALSSCCFNYQLMNTFEPTALWFTIVLFKLKKLSWSVQTGAIIHNHIHNYLSILESHQALSVEFYEYVTYHAQKE